MDSQEPRKQPKIIPRERLEFVEGLWLRGTSDRLIQRKTSRQYGVTTRTARRYIALVRAKIAALPKPEPEAVIARCEDMLVQAFNAARTRQRVTEHGTVPNPDAASMTASAFRLAELHGAVAPRRHELTGKDGGPIETRDVASLTPEERRAEIDRIKRELRLVGVAGPAAEGTSSRP